MREPGRDRLLRPGWWLLTFVWLLVVGGITGAVAYGAGAGGLGAAALALLAAAVAFAYSWAVRP